MLRVTRGVDQKAVGVLCTPLISCRPVSSELMIYLGFFQVSVDSEEHTAQSDDKEMSLCLCSPWGAPVHERNTSQRTRVVEVLMRAGRGMPPIAHIVLKHALFQHEQL